MPANLRRWQQKEELTSENFNQRTTELENYLNEQENKNINSDKVVFSDGETFQQKLDAGTLRGEKGEQGQTGERGPQGLQGNVDTTEIRQIKSEAEEHLRKAIQLLRSVQVNVEGTVLETQFMKKATFDNDNDGVVDRAKTLNNIVKAIDFTGKFQKEAYRKTVIALCEITNENASLYSYTQGEFYFRRSNGLHPAISIKVNAQKTYNQAKMMINVISFGTNKECAKPCTFNYNNKTYGGIEFYYEPAEHSKIEFTGLTNFEIFGVDYYNTYTKSAINEEIANSIDYKYFIYSYYEIFNNQNKIYHSGNQTVALTNRENVFTQSQIFNNADLKMGVVPNGGNATDLSWHKIGENTKKIAGIAVTASSGVPYNMSFYIGNNSSRVNPIIEVKPDLTTNIRGELKENNKRVATLEYVQQLEQRIQALERKTQNL